MLMVKVMDDVWMYTWTKLNLRIQKEFIFGIWPLQGVTLIEGRI